MRALLASAAVLGGAAFMFVAALGVVRLPDVYTRMQAATKASTVGVVGMMFGVAALHYDWSVTIRAVLVAAFFLLTSPIAAHAIARSALARGVPVAPGTRVGREVQARATPSSPGAPPAPHHVPRVPQGDPGGGRVAPDEAAGELRR
jgi:multicomponent Na+:H+ antiporter subunit G